MKTLSALFLEDRNQIQLEIEQAINLSEVVTIVQNKLEKWEKTYISQLSLTQVRLASFFLEMLQQSISMLVSSKEIEFKLPEQKTLTLNGGEFSLNSLILKILQGIVCIVLGAWSFSVRETLPGAWITVLLLIIILIGLEFALQIDKIKPPGQETVSSNLALPKAVVKVDSQVFLDNLANALNTIDLAVSRVEDWNKPIEGEGLEELPELLNFLQRLMGASFLEKPQMTIELTRLLPQILRQQGIYAQNYQPNKFENEREYFDFEPSIDPASKDYITITPALLKGDRLIKKGRVIEPNQVD